MASQMPRVYSAGGGHVILNSPQPQILMMPTLPPQPVTTSNRRLDGSRFSFAHNSARYCGIIQIVCGFILLIIGISMIPSRAMFNFIGYGLWGSILCFVAGGLGLHSSKTKNNCPIIGTMVMSIFTCLLGFVLVAFSTAGIALDERLRRCLEVHTQMKFKDAYRYSCSRGPSGPPGSIDEINFRVACHSINMLVGIVLMIVPIVQSCVSCRAICCPTPNACFPQQQPIVYMMQQQGGAAGQIVYRQPLQVYDQPATNQPPLGYGQHAVTTQMPCDQASAYAQLTVASAPPTGADDVAEIHGLPSYDEAFTSVKSD
ncbi:uncharacterized protein LOC141908759 [Tubulanus polymorphus]|uniref:uncharacterized protein LOC141908759 n=1 Tax=Tubulanus polymorphus TaxID=672921 RepID=UPI003DA3A55B